MTMTRKQKFFIIARVVFLFFAVLALAVVVALSQIDMNNLRGSLLGVLRSSTNMPIEIDGDVSWKFSLRPHVTMNKIRIPNEKNKKHKNLFEASSIEVRLDLFSLFSNRPTIRNVRVNDAKVFLDKDKNGEFYIPKISEEEPKKDVEQEAEVQTEQPEYPFVDPGLGGIDINKATILIDGSKYNLARFSFRYRNSNDKREYRGWIKIDNTVIPVIASFNKYNSERKVYPLSVAFSSDGDALVADIALEGTSKLPIDFVVKGTIPDIRPIGKFLNIDLPKIPVMGVNISGGVVHDKITLHKSTITLRGVDFIVSGSFDWGKKRQQINLNASVKKLNLVESFPGIYSGKKQPDGYVPNVFHDMPLFGKFLYDNDVKLNASLGTLVVYRNLKLENLNAVLVANNGKVRLDADTNFAGGHVRGAIDGHVNSNGVYDIEFGGAARSVTVGKILNEINIKDFISELPIDFDVYARASGKNMSEIMSSYTGPIKARSTANGYAHEKLVAYMYGSDFLTSLRHTVTDLFSSEKKYNQMTIKSVAVNLKFRNGLAETKNGVAIETNTINLLLDGSIDLGKEQINLSLTTIPVRGLKLSLSGNVVNTISINGNLAEPDINISGAAIAGKALSATGLGLLLTPITGGLSLVAGAGIGLVAGDLLENWLADDNPTKTALNKGAPPRHGDPEWLNSPVSGLSDSVLFRNSAKQ